MQNFTNIDAARDFLFSRHAKGMKLGLAHMQELVQRLDQPQHRFPSVHIAGTNGKGSTAAILEAVLRAAGLRTGLYTSPHLCDERERIRVAGQKIETQELLSLVEAMRPHIEATDASFFEILTAVAFVHFANSQVDLAVLETGLGGRLDATSVVTPALSVITRIGKDHTRILGDRLEAIAAEKAGILKPGRPGLIGERHPRVRRFFEGHGSERGIPLTFAGDHVRISRLKATEDGTTFDCKTRDSHYRDLELRLIGRHQAENAALALQAVDLLREQGFAIPEAAVRQGLAQVRWPARLEKIQDAPKIVIDSAHNPMGTRSLAKAIGDLFTYRRLILVFGVLADKDYRTMLGHLAPLADEIVLTRPLSDRALEPDALVALSPHGKNDMHVVPDISEAWSLAKSLAGSQDLIVAAGSIYFVGEVLTLEGQKRPELIP